jgi:hypothetical protein
MPCPPTRDAPETSTTGSARLAAFPQLSSQHEWSRLAFHVALSDRDSLSTRRERLLLARPRSTGKVIHPVG